MSDRTGQPDHSHHGARVVRSANLLAKYLDVAEQTVRTRLGRRSRPLTALRDHPAHRRLAHRKSAATVLVVLSQRDAASAVVYDPSWGQRA